MTTLLVTNQGHVRTLTLHRPERLNAFTAEAYGTLADALISADDDDGVHAIVLTGAGRAFSSGVDLDALRAGDVADFSRTFRRLLETLIELRTPLIAAVHGAAVGFGATILLHCDIVVVAHDARIRFPFTQLGTAPEAASSLLLTAAIGSQRASEILLTSRWVSGEEAAAIGLAAVSAPVDEVLGRALDIAAKITQQHQGAVVAAKHLIKASAADIRAAIDRETASAERLGPIGTSSHHGPTAAPQ
jgi:enoyl-CoA hydratase/carnithine racemase